MDQPSDENPWGKPGTHTTSKINKKAVFDSNTKGTDISTDWGKDYKNTDLISNVNIFEEPVSGEEQPSYKGVTLGNPSENNALKKTKANNQKTDLGNWFQELRNEYSKFVAFSSKVSITQLELKGMAFFKYREYELDVYIDGGNKYKITRRYSDFSWLLDYLLQKYPFRLLPELPPKIIPKNDVKVLKKRLEGLVYFSEVILNHPVVSKNDVVNVFYQVDCEFATWRKNNNNKLDFSEEFLNLKIDQGFLNGWDKRYMFSFVNSLSKVDTQMIIWEKLIQHIERRYAKQKALFNEEFNMIHHLGELSSNDLLNETFPLIDELNYLEIHNTKTFLEETKKCFNDLVDLPKQEHYFTESFDRIISSFHIVLMIFQAMKSLKERFDCLSGNSILVLNSKIESNIQHLNNLIKNSPDSKSQEYDFIQKTIIRDKIELREQLNRQWLIKKCIMEEFLWFNELNKFIKENTLSEYIKENSQFTQLCASKWSNMVDL